MMVGPDKELNDKTAKTLAQLKTTKMGTHISFLNITQDGCMVS